MHPIFHIKSSDIQALNSQQANELAARLLKEELRTKGIDLSAINWTENLNAADGGVDIAIEIQYSHKAGGYIPRNSTFYQIKTADEISKKYIEDEMAPKRELRKNIIKLEAKNGAYIIFATKIDLPSMSPDNRPEHMRECLKRYGVSGKIFTDFYTSRKIADWVEKHPAIVIWLRKELGKSTLRGWRSYEPWAYKKDEYLLDKEPKIIVFNPSQLISTRIKPIEAISDMRACLNKDHIRIIGLSGVGKTCLVQALFDDRITTDVHYLSEEQVIYTDLFNNPDPSPVEMVESLIKQELDCLLIIDNCDQKTHQDLAAIINKSPNNKKHRLVTIGYDTSDETLEKTFTYSLEGASDNLLKELLKKRRLHTLSDLDIEKIIKFSDGNPKIALSLAFTCENKGELACLGDRELLKRLVFQKDPENPVILRCAEIFSLLYSVDRENKEEIEILSNSAGVNPQEFRRNIYELEKRGLIKKKGQFRGLLPLAISNRLASIALEWNDLQELIQKYVTHAPERVAISFSKRLSYLDKSEQAEWVAKDLLKSEGFLGDLNNLKEKFKWDDVVKQIPTPH